MEEDYDWYFNWRCSYFIMHIFMSENFILEKFGKIPLCNCKPDRAPHIGKFCFPLCWRCFGISIGVIFVTILIEINLIKINCASITSILFSISIILPCLIDSLLQKFSNYISTNIKRFLFGGVSGIGIRLFVFFLIQI